MDAKTVILKKRKYARYVNINVLPVNTLSIFAQNVVIFESLHHFVYVLNDTTKLELHNVNLVILNVYNAQKMQLIVLFALN